MDHGVLERHRQQRLDLALEVFHVDLVHLGGDLQRQTALRSDLDSCIDALFRADAAEEREVLWLLVRLRREQGVYREQTRPRRPLRTGLLIVLIALMFVLL